MWPLQQMADGIVAHNKNWTRHKWENYFAELLNIAQANKFFRTKTKRFEPGLKSSLVKTRDGR